MLRPPSVSNPGEGQRTADQDGTIYVDNGRPDGAVIRICQERWEVTNTAPVRFLSFPRQSIVSSRWPMRPLLSQQHCAARGRQGERRPGKPVPRAGVVDHFGDRADDASKDPPLAPLTNIQVGEADLGDQDVVLAPNPGHLADRPAQRQRADDVARLQPTMEPDEVEFLVCQHIRCQAADTIGSRIDENPLPLLGVCD
ncbi:MAG TPA: hypothetical protein VGA66_13600 [Mycobacterium sp.]